MVQCRGFAVVSSEDRCESDALDQCAFCQDHMTQQQTLRKKYKAYTDKAIQITSSDDKLIDPRNIPEASIPAVYAVYLKRYHAATMCYQNRLLFTERFVHPSARDEGHAAVIGYWKRFASQCEVMISEMNERYHKYVQKEEQVFKSYLAQHRTLVEQQQEVVDFQESIDRYNDEKETELVRNKLVDEIIIEYYLACNNGNRWDFNKHIKTSLGDSSEEIESPTESPKGHCTNSQVDAMVEKSKYTIGFLDEHSIRILLCNHPVNVINEVLQKCRIIAGKANLAVESMRNSLHIVCDHLRSCLFRLHCLVEKELLKNFIKTLNEVLVFVCGTYESVKTSQSDRSLVDMLQSSFSRNILNIVNTDFDHIFNWTTDVINIGVHMSTHDVLGLMLYMSQLVFGLNKMKCVYYCPKQRGELDLFKSVMNDELQSRNETIQYFLKITDEAKGPYFDELAKAARTAIAKQSLQRKIRNN